MLQFRGWDAHNVDGVELHHILAENFIGDFVPNAKMVSQERLLPAGVFLSLLQTIESHFIAI